MIVEGQGRGKGVFPFLRGEVCALYTRGAFRLETQLLFMRLLDPLPQVGQPTQRPGGGLRLDQRAEHGCWIVVYPVSGDAVADCVVMSVSFRVDFTRERLSSVGEMQQVSKIRTKTIQKQ